MATSHKPHPIKRFRVWYHERRLVIFANSWALAIGWLAIFSSISYFLDPATSLDHAAIGLALKGWAYVWNSLYLLGGIGIVVGILRARRGIDMAGLCFMAGALLINAVCTIALRGGGGAGAPALIALAIAAIMRIRILYLIGRL